MYKNNYKPWTIKIYMYIVQMHIKSEVKSFEDRVCQGFTHFSALFRPYGFTAVAYNLCVFEAKHFFFQPSHRPELDTAG